MEKLKTKKKPGKPSNLRSSSLNLLLNVSIFLLVLLIIYMSYSIYVKLSHKPGDNIELSNGQNAADIVQVEVLNGCGIGGVADRFTDQLRAKGADVVKIGNYISNDIGETLVIDRIGNIANAYKVARMLGVKNENVIQQMNKDYFLDVSVIIGRDYFNLTPFK